MSEGNKNHYGKALAASVGILGICATAIVLHSGLALWGLLLVGMIVYYVD
jgi:hypothetical protein